MYLLILQNFNVNNFIVIVYIMSTKEISLTGGRTMPVRDFKLEYFCANPAICMIAKRGSGKSVVCMAIINHFNYLPGGIIISPTDKMSCFYGNFFPQLYIHYQYKSEILESLLYRQRMIIKKCKKRYKSGKKVDPRAFLVMDDCLASKGTWMSDQPILEIFYNGRHYQLLFILTMQFPLGIKPELRSNFDYIFLLADDFYSNQKRLFDHYAGMFPTFDIFRQVFMQLTDDFGCMVIVNRGQRKTLLDKVFHFKVDNPDFKCSIGCQQFKEFDKNNYDPHWDDDKGITFDITNYDKKSKNNIIVSKVVNGGEKRDTKR